MPGDGKWGLLREGGTLLSPGEQKHMSGRLFYNLGDCSGRDSCCATGDPGGEGKIRLA